MRVAFFAGMALTGISGAIFYIRGRAGYLFSAAATATFPVAVASILSFICLYIYELPTHHCPFCLLQKEYGSIGYLLYATLFGGAVAGLGTGVLMPFRRVGSLIRIVPSIQRRLAGVTMVCYLLFTVIVVWEMISSALTLG
jgi:hypothetical protein